MNLLYCALCSVVIRSYCFFTILHVTISLSNFLVPLLLSFTYLRGCIEIYFAQTGSVVTIRLNAQAQVRARCTTMHTGERFSENGLSINVNLFKSENKISRWWKYKENCRQHFIMSIKHLVLMQTGFVACTERLSARTQSHNAHKHFSEKSETYVLPQCLYKYCLLLILETPSVGLQRSSSLWRTVACTEFIASSSV